MKRLIAYFILLAIIGMKVHGNDDSSIEPLVSSINRTIVDIYRPFHDELADSGEDLLAHTELLCSNPDQSTLATAHGQFDRFVYRFARIEFYRVGPMLLDNRKNRLFYWPDKRRVGERQMRALLNSAESATLTTQQLSAKSVALQGIPALERLLFSSAGADLFSESTSGNECRVLLAIAGNLRSIVNSMSQEWVDSEGISYQMTHATPGARLFRSEDEVIRSLVTQIVVGLDVIAEKKLAPLLSSTKAALRDAPLWKSQQTVRMLDGNLEGIRALILDSGLASRGGLHRELQFEFRTVEVLLDKLKALTSLSSDTRTLNEDALSLIRSLAAVVDGIRLTVNDRLVSTLGISAGFNSEDGD
ncbi:MAG: imelysin family protein [Granulosicoccus sp.]